MGKVTNHSLSVIFTITSDNLRLQGMHYAPTKKSDTCILMIHGMAGNFIENVFANNLGLMLSNTGYGCIYTHNRGYSLMNDVAINSVKPDNGFEYSRSGVAYERFVNCVKDIDAWIQAVHKLGYHKIILLGHSLGAIKTIYWWSKQTTTPKGIVGIILASPADMVGLARKNMAPTEYQNLITEARDNIKHGYMSRLLSKQIDDWCFISSQTFIDEMVDHCPADVLPTKRNPEIFRELATINVPILCFFGEYDSAVIKSPSADLKLIKSKATACPDFQTTIIKGANHTYENRENQFAQVILEWVKSLKPI